jgi:hypothetical protein
MRGKSARKIEGSSNPVLWKAAAKHNSQECEGCSVHDSMPASRKIKSPVYRRAGGAKGRMQQQARPKSATVNT